MRPDLSLGPPHCACLHSFEDCIIECEAKHEAHALLVDSRGVAEVRGRAGLLQGRACGAATFGPHHGHFLRVDQL